MLDALGGSGFPCTLGGKVKSSPTCYDVNNDSRKEIVAGNNDGKIYIIDNTSNTIPEMNLSVKSQTHSCAACFKANGNIYTVFSSIDGSVHMMDKTGQLVWEKQLGGIVQASVTVADINNDGAYEIITGSTDGKIYAFDLNGNDIAGWPVDVGEWITSTAAVSSDSGSTNAMIVFGAWDGRLYALDGGGAIIWSRQTGGPIESSPAIADINLDGKKEVMVGSDDGYVYAFSLSDGTPVSGWPAKTSGPVESSPVAGDILGDGKIKIVFGSDDGNIYALNADGTPMANFPISTGDMVDASAALADVDGDNVADIVIGSRNSYLYALKGSGASVSGFPVKLQTGISASAAIDNFNGMGLADIIVPAGDEMYVIETSGNPIKPWITFMGNMQRTGDASGGQINSYETPGKGGSSFTMSPNPFSRSLKISINRLTGPGLVEIFNSVGQKIRSLKVYGTGDDVSMIWDGRDDNGAASRAGVYDILIKTEGSVSDGKAVLFR